MMSCTYSLFNRMCIASARRTVLTAAATEVQDNTASNTAPFRITESFPVQDESHLNRIYALPSDLTEKLRENLPNEMQKQVDIFRELGILVRKPAVEIISYLEQADYTKSINKYVLYGKNGAGKTTTLAHLINYGFTKKFIVLHLPWVCTWYRFPKEVAESPLTPEKLDVPKDAALWLKYFKQLNESLLSQFDLKVSKDYVWSQRETINSGDSLLNLVEFGIQRTKFACGVIDALITELKLASTAGKCRTFIVIDGFNAFTSEHTLIRDDTRAYVPPERISITSSFFNSVDYNWCNGAAILTVDKRANKERRESDYPKYLLGKKGFEHLDPFLPIGIEDYSKEEFNTIIEYYKDRKWLREISPQGYRELELLSNNNPAELWKLCRSL